MRLLASSIILASAASALAQPFVMESNTCDSGGAIDAAAGSYLLNGTIGQPDAGILIAATYECQGGFWNTDGASPPTCYPNCDGSTGTPSLTANDFQCFINAYAAGAAYANCDGSTGTPTLTANDFQCFINTYAGGCS
jgi:hypothetical protein